MCISPILIKNPNKGKFVSDYLRTHTDCVSDFIYVPCGYCRECIAVKQMYFVQRARMEALNSFLFFSTLTYDNAHLPKVCTSTCFEIPYVELSHLQNLFKRLRSNNSFGRPFRYFAVSERGSENSRPHVHILWFLPKFDNEDFSDGLSLNRLLYDSIRKYWSINVGSDKCPIYEPLFTFKQRFYRGKLFSNYDTHYVVPSLTSSGYNSVAFYCCKYLFKVSPKEQRLQQALHLNLSPDEYEFIWSMVRSQAYCSKSFGLGSEYSNNLSIVQYLRSCIARSDRSLGYPQFFNPDSSQVFPLAPFYRSKGFICPASIMDTFTRDSLYADFTKNTTEVSTAVSELERVSSLVEKDLSININFLFD